MNRKFGIGAILALWLVGSGTGAATPDAGLATGSPRLQTGRPTGRVVVRFAAGSGLEFVDSSLGVKKTASNTSQATRNLRQAMILIDKLAPGSVWRARVPAAGAARDRGSASPLVHALARTGDFVAPDREPDALRRLVARLRDDPLVELAWLEPHTEPASLDFGREPALRPLREARLAPADTASADFTALQGYRGPAPDGIGSLAVADLPGADGAGIGVIDVEGGWLWSHEDLPAPLAQLGTQIDSDAWRFHGTAVLGVIRGHPNGVGVTGIAPACQVGNSSMGGETTTAEAILAAADVLSPGDVIVIELHGAGPNATGFGQEGFVPMEFWQDNFDAIREATLRGLIVVEAAGNGWENLDDPVYLGLFVPDLRHSGAIMVGATEAGTLSPAWWTNNGSRVDLNGWGSQVTTLSYGDLQGAPAFPEEQWYTATFNGTSSATPR